MAIWKRTQRVCLLLTSILLLTGAAGLAGGQARQPDTTDEAIRTSSLDPLDEEIISIREDAGQAAPDPVHDTIPNLPADAKKLVLDLETDKNAETQVARTKACVVKLQELQAAYAKAGNLDAAVAIRNTVMQLKLRMAGVLENPGNLTAYRGRTGETLQFHVTGAASGSLWGTNIYTDDSSLGMAAVHQGLLREGQSGVIRVFLLPGQSEYEGAERNGVTSQDYGEWQGSYSIDAGIQIEEPHPAGLPDAAKSLLADLDVRSPNEDSAVQARRCLDNLRILLEKETKANRLDEALAIRDAALALVARLLEAQADPGNLTALRGRIGQTYCFEVTGRQNGSVWGSQVYTDDSDIGTVAVHAGLLRPGQKGIVRVLILPGFAQYEATEQNGIRSRSYGPWEGSYRIEAIPF